MSRCSTFTETLGLRRKGLWQFARKTKRNKVSTHACIVVVKSPNGSCSAHPHSSPVSYPIQHTAQVLQHLDSISKFLTCQLHVDKPVSRDGLLASPLRLEIRPVPLKVHVALHAPFRLQQVTCSRVRGSEGLSAFRTCRLDPPYASAPSDECCPDLWVLDFQHTVKGPMLHTGTWLYPRGQMEGPVVVQSPLSTAAGGS